MRKSYMFIALLAIVSICMNAQNRVVRIMQNGGILNSFPVEQIDSIIIDEVIDTPSGFTATVSERSVILTWTEVANATYDVYHSTDNLNFSVLVSDLTELSYTDNNPFSGANFYKIKAVVDSKESDYSSSVIATVLEDTLAKGIYLGVTGFNVDLYKYPISQINEISVPDFCNFVDGMQVTQQTGTLLYYAIDQAINTLQSSHLPSNLSTAAIVTFTDGIDQGSVMKNPQYNYDDLLYLDGMHNRIVSETIANIPITAYSIGLLGTDVNNDEERNLFKKNLRMLASNEDKAFEVESMDEVNNKFSDIATQLAVSNFMQTITIKVPGVGNGVRLRFTFDDVNNVKDSKLYIEGTLNLIDGSFDDIEFVGMTSTSQGRVYGVLDDLGINYSFTFDGVHTDDNTRITNDFQIKEWRYYPNSDSWNRNSEFDPFEDASIVTTRKSAVIMLLLDCSRSLSNSFDIIQNHAKNFIRILSDNSINPDEVASVELDRTEITLPVGEAAILKATVSPSTALLQTVEWSSSNPSVATVDNSGNIKAMAPGTANIIVKTVDGGFTAVCKVTVVTLAQEIQLDNSSLVIYKGETNKLHATVYPVETTNTNVNWSSSQTSIATVDSDGVVTPISSGKTTITATTTDGTNLKASCEVTVLLHVESISIKQEDVFITVGEQQYLSATIIPANASNKNIIWSSSNPDIVKVDNNGLITGVEKGSAIITVESEEGGKTSTCHVEVIKIVSSITLNQSFASLNVDESLQLTTTVMPYDAYNKSIAWTSSNPTIASVDSTGLVQALSSGTVTITAKSQDGSNIEADCIITVNQPVTDVSLSTTNLSVIIGNSGTFTVNILPSDATDQTFSVASSNTSIATVSQSGKNVYVTGIAFGTATITVISEDGGYNASCDVTVTPSTTPSHLALALKKDNIMYYIPYSEYTSVPTGYTKEGVAIYNGSIGVVLKLSQSFDATGPTYTFDEANKRATLPTSTQAQLIVDNWSSVNNALTKYGGTSLGTNKYWTSSSRGNGGWGYYFNSSGVTLAGNSSEKCYYRGIINL